MFIIISIKEEWDIEICWLNREDNKIAIKHHRTFLFEKKTELNSQILTDKKPYYFTKHYKKKSTKSIPRFEQVYKED